LSNLLSNATRYTESGGVLFAARHRNGQICIQVFDTGIGIEAGAFESIFSEFTQLNNPARDPARGTGVGLATVQRMVRLLDHELGLKSIPGKGSCFHLSIAMTSAPAPVAPTVVSAEPDVAGNALAGLRLLVVEDNALVADALSTMLKAWRLDVTVAVDAHTAMEALKHNSFDVLISDWRLPGAQDGLAVLRFAKASHPSLRLAALLTGDNVEHLGNEFPVITKPVRALRMRAMLSAHLR
jgi:CheY-like chemotaxis protein